MLYMCRESTANILIKINWNEAHSIRRWSFFTDLDKLWLDNLTKYICTFIVSL